MIRSNPGMVLAVLLLLSTSSLCARPSLSGEAEAAYQAGKADVRSGDADAALAKFELAYELSGAAFVLLAIGITNKLLDRPAAAINAFERYLRAGGEEKREDVQADIAQLLPRVGTLQLTIEGPTVDIELDGEAVPLAEARHPIRVTPGEHTIAVRNKAGSADWKTVTVAAGEIAHVELDLTMAAPDSEETQPAQRADQSSNGSVLPWVVGGVGAVGLTAAAVFYVQHTTATARLEQRCIANVCPEAEQDTIDRANTSGTLALATFGIGLAGVGTAAYLLVAGRSGATGTASPNVSWTIEPGVRGMSVRGSF